MRFVCICGLSGFYISMRWLIDYGKKREREKEKEEKNEKNDQPG